MEATVSHLLRLRRENPVLRPKRFYTEHLIDQDPVPDLGWFDAEGHHMPEHKWFDAQGRTLQMLRSGQGHNADALLVINGSISPRDVRLPTDRGESYTLAWDSAWKKPRTTLPVYAAGAMTNLEALSIRLYLLSRVS